MNSENIPHMDWLATNQAQTFKLFKQRLELYFKVKKIKKEEQVSYILLQVGDEGLRRFNAWALSDEELKDPDIIFQRFVEQLEPPENFRVCRLKLMQYRQGHEECLDDFVNRCKLLALKCDFSESELNERLLELIIASTPITDYQKELLLKDKGYKLCEAIRLGRTYEAADSNVKQLKDMCSPTQSNVNVIRGKMSYSQGYNTKTTNGANTCYNCGRNHSFKSREICPAYRTRCNLCGKENHWSNVCKSNRKDDVGLTQANARTSEFRSRPRGQQKPWDQNRNKQYVPNAGRSGGRHRDIHEFQSERQTPDHSDQEPDNVYEQCNKSFETINFSELQVSNLCLDNITGRDVAYVSLCIRLSNRPGIHKLQLKVDTGAQANTLPLRIFRCMFPEYVTEEGYPIPSISNSARKVKLTAYNGTNIACYGVVRIACKYQKSDWTDIDFYIVGVSGSAIFGLRSSETLKIVTLNCAIQANKSSICKQNIRNVDDLKQMYQGQFDKIGCFPGEAKLFVSADYPPHVDAPRKAPIALKDTIQKELEYMVKNGVIRKVTEPTDWVSSIVYSHKQDGGLRLCLDPKHLNRALKRPHYKLPTVDEITHHFRGAKVFSKLDAKSGYWSVRLDPESQLLTTFQSPFGRYCFQRLPFGLSVSQDIFQLKMDQILEQVEGAVGIADDVAVYAKDEAEHDRILHNLMQVAEQNGLVFNSSKCHIKTRKITFFGTVYADTGIHPDPRKITDLKMMPTPTNKKELQEFLGFITYLSPFIPNLSAQSSRLRDLLKHNSSFLWETHHQMSFDTLKSIVTEDSTLQYFDTNITPVVQADASLCGLGAVLLQEGKPVAYASKALSDIETRYACIERELLAIVFSVNRFHTYLYGRYFKIVTDHKPLVMISQKPLIQAPARLQRMLLKLQGYKFDIEYKPGKEMLVADMLSRMPNRANQQTIDLDVRVDLVKFDLERLENIRTCTRQDPVLYQLCETIMVGWPDTIKEVPTPIRPYWTYRDELSVDNGIILKGSRVLIPCNLRENILQQLHYGHQGIEKTKLRAKDAVYWNGINGEIENMVKACAICQSNLPAQTSESLLPHEIPSKPWEIVGTDLFHFNGSEYLIIADYYSKFPVVRKMPNQFTSGVIIGATKQIFSEYGIPRRVISDNGPQYSSCMYRDFAKEWCFDHVTSSPRYPQSNGFVERQVRTVKQLFEKARQANTDKELALLCLRTTPISSNLPSPGEILMNRKIRSNLPIKVHNSKFIDNDLVKEVLQDRQNIQKKYHDRNTQDLPPLIPGQSVRIQNYHTGKWDTAKVSQKCNEPRSYLVDTPEGQTLRRNRVHIRESTEPVFSGRTNCTKPTAEGLQNACSSGEGPAEGSVHSRDTESNCGGESGESHQGDLRTRSGRVVKKPDLLDL